MLAFVLVSGQIMAQEQGFLGTTRSKPARPLAPQLKVGRNSPKSKAHKKRYRTRGSQPSKVAKRQRDTRSLFFPKGEPSRQPAGNVGYRGPSPRKGVRDDRKYIPSTPKAKPDSKNFGKFASGGPPPKKRVRDDRKYYPTSPDSKSANRQFGRFAQSGPPSQKRVRDTRKYYPTTPIFKVDTKNFGRFAQKGPPAEGRFRDKRPRKIAGIYRRAAPPAGRGAYFNEREYLAKKDSRAQKPKKRGFLEGAYFNTPLPRKPTGKIAGLSANYQGNLTVRPGASKYSKQVTSLNANYQGNLIRRPVAKYSKQIANYTGHRGDMRRYRIRMTREPATYAGGERVFQRSTGVNISGLLTFKRANKIYPRKDIAKYSGKGGVLVKDHYRRSWYNKTKESVSYYFSNLNLAFKDSRLDAMEKSTRESANYVGRYKLSRPAKGAHPTAIYARNSIRHKSVEKRETNRKRNLWINRLFVFRGKDQPDDFKKKVRKPKYDRKEHQIWNE